MSTPNGRVYRVVLSEQVQAKLKELHRRAKDKGYEAQVLSAAKRIVATLRAEPLPFGEPRFKLHHLSLEVRVGTVPLLVVIYGVERHQGIVFVRDFLSVPGSGF
jgi:hypothetical protein